MILVTTSYERFYGVGRIAFGEEINCVEYGLPGGSRKSRLGSDVIPFIDSDLLKGQYLVWRGRNISLSDQWQCLESGIRLIIRRGENKIHAAGHSKSTACELGGRLTLN